MMGVKNQQPTTTRRKFIKTATVTGSGLMILPRHTIGGKRFVPPSDKVNLALIGAGGISRHHLEEVFKLDDVQIISITDPADYWKFNKQEGGRGPRKESIEEHYLPKTPNYKITEYEDFRIMLDKDKAVDAVICCTPDNTHAYISIMSMRAGKHVYCQKPLTHNIWESRKVAEVAKDTGVATQMGNQGHSRDCIRQTVEYLRAGAIGTVHESYSWVGATRYQKNLIGYPDKAMSVPRGFNWDLWLGPTSFRPYNSAYTPFTWRDFWVFGNGALGDFGCHDMDAATWAFDLQSPEIVQVFPAGNKRSSEVTPYGEIGHFYFAARGDLPPYKITWFSGGLLPEHPENLPRSVKLESRGAIFIGDKGVILNNGGTNSPPMIFPESLRNSFMLPKQSIPRIHGQHHREWVDAIKGGTKALSNFDYASRLTELTLLGTLSLRLGGEKIYWDSKNMKAVGLPEADEIIRESVREGWEMV